MMLHLSFKQVTRVSWRGLWISSIYYLICPCRSQGQRSGPRGSRHEDRGMWTFQSKMLSWILNDFKKEGNCSKKGNKGSEVNKRLRGQAAYHSTYYTVSNIDPHCDQTSSLSEWKNSKGKQSYSTNKCLVRTEKSFAFSKINSQSSDPFITELPRCWNTF